VGRCEIALSYNIDHSTISRLKGVNIFADRRELTRAEAAAYADVVT
jgi:hypothetical protein